MNELFLLEKPDEHSWCVYTDEQQWRENVGSFRARNTSTAEFTNDRISVLHLTTNDAAGDWVVHDTYSFGKAERLDSLKRTINVISSDVSEEEEWRISGTKPIRTERTLRNLKTQKPIARAGIRLPELPVITNREKFPFWRLIRTAKTSPNSVNCTK